MLCQWFVLFVILSFHLSFSYLWSSDVSKLLGIFQFIHARVYLYICINIYKERESCIYSVYAHTQTHTYRYVCT